MSLRVLARTIALAVASLAHADEVDQQTAPKTLVVVASTEGWEYPRYVPRGRYDDGAYVSVEH